MELKTRKEWREYFVKGLEEKGLDYRLIDIDKMVDDIMEVDKEPRYKTYIRIAILAIELIGYRLARIIRFER